jgi:hypothetical protein
VFLLIGVKINAVEVRLSKCEPIERVPSIDYVISRAVAEAGAEILNSHNFYNHLFTKDLAQSHKVTIVQRCRGEYVGETDNPFGKGLYTIYYDPAQFILSNFINNSTTYSYEVELNPAGMPCGCDMDETYDNSPSGLKIINVDDGAPTDISAPGYGIVHVFGNGVDYFGVYDDSALFGIGTYGAGIVWPWSGAGTGIVWTPKKAAFRAGRTLANEWDAANVGIYSFAGGLGNTHSGDYSGGWGRANIASADYSGGWGYQNTFSGDYSGGWGWYNTFSGDRSGGWGRNNTNAGLDSGAVGLANDISNSSSNCFAIGDSNYVEGNNSVAFGEGNKVRSHEAGTVGLLNYVDSLNSFIGGFQLWLTAEADLSHAFGSHESMVQLPQTDTFYGIVDKLIMADPSTLGAEKLTNGTFTGSAANWTLAAGWTYNSNAVDKDGDGVGTLSQTAGNMVTPPVADEIYLLEFTISNWTVGTVVPSLGVVNGASVGEDGTYYQLILARDAGNLIFTPSNTARFTIDTVSLKEVTGGDMHVAGGIYSQGEQLTPNTDNEMICWDDITATVIGLVDTPIVSPHCIPLTGNATYTGIYISRWIPDLANIDTITITLYVDGIATDTWTTAAGVAGSYGAPVAPAIIALTQGHYCQIWVQITGLVGLVDTIWVQSATCNVEIN